MITAWFFDLDGTLARTGEDIVSAWKGALKEMGRDLSRFDEVFRIGPTLEKVVYELYDDATPDLVAELLARFKPRYDESGFLLTRPYPGVPEALTALKAKGMRLFIVTNKRDVPTRRLAAKFGWDRLFDGVWSYDSFEAPLEKKALIARILVECSLPPEEAVMVGDTAGDVSAGQANGMKTVGVTWGYGSRDALGAADRLVDSAFELARLEFD